MIQYQSIGQQCVTFFADDSIIEGVPCKMSANSTITAANSGDTFFGIVEKIRSDLATVTVRGFVTLAYSGTAPSVGAAYLCADGNGGVSVAASGNSYVIVDVNTTNHLVTFLI